MKARVRLLKVSLGFSPIFLGSADFALSSLMKWSSGFQSFGKGKMESYVAGVALALGWRRPVLRFKLVFNMVTAVAMMKEKTNAASPK